jgi:predicted anti-sigma-YlaC factor YlaD
MTAFLTCAECREALPAYLAATTPPATTQLVADHLEGCPECAQRLTSAPRAPER